MVNQYPFIGTYGFMFEAHVEAVEKERWDLFDLTLTGTLICLN